MFSLCDLCAFRVFYFYYGESYYPFWLIDFISDSSDYFGPFSLMEIYSAHPVARKTLHLYMFVGFILFSLASIYVYIKERRFHLNSLNDASCLYKNQFIFFIHFFLEKSSDGFFARLMYNDVFFNIAVDFLFVYSMSISVVLLLSVIDYFLINKLFIKEYL